MSEVGTPPPHNLDKTHGLVDSNNNNIELRRSDRQPEGVDLRRQERLPSQSVYCNHENHCKLCWSHIYRPPKYQDSYQKARGYDNQHPRETGGHRQRHRKSLAWEIAVPVREEKETISPNQGNPLLYFVCKVHEGHEEKIRVQR